MWQGRGAKEIKEEINISGVDLLPPWSQAQCVLLRSYSQRDLKCPCPPRNSGTRVIVSGKHERLALCSTQSLPTLREPWECAGSSAFFPDKSASAYNKTHSGVKRVDVQACRVSLINNNNKKKKDWHWAGFTRDQRIYEVFLFEFITSGQ